MESYGKPGFELAAEELGIADAAFHPMRKLDERLANFTRYCEQTADWYVGASASYREIAGRMAAEREAKVRSLLGQWVSEIPPAIAFGPDGEIAGLCDADAPLGSRPFIFQGNV